MSTVFVKTYLPPPIDRKEILRYAGVREENDEISSLLDACLSEAYGKLSYKIVARTFPITEKGDWLDLGFAHTESRALKKNLLGCTEILLFAATVGIELDRLITKYSALSPTKALLLQAIGAERVESLCDVFCRDFAEELSETGHIARPRFSPGYGDLSLTLQRDVFAVLDCSRKIGISLGENLLMTPSKSVTAIVGY